MFTGLVAETGVVRAVERGGDGARLDIAARLAGDLAPGDSVAVSGVCLTAVEVGPETFRVELVAETLERSSLGALADGGRVNLELPLRAADRLGGHVVQGHVDGVGTVEAVADQGFSRRLAVQADAGLCRYVVDKGSVALDGVSLTAVDVAATRFAAALVPETLERTTLGAATVGDSLNVEVDVLAKHVEKLMRGGAGAGLAAAGERR